MPLAARPVRVAIMCVLCPMDIVDRPVTPPLVLARLPGAIGGSRGKQAICASLLARVPSNGLSAAIGELAGRHRQRPVRVGDARVFLHGLVAPAQQELGGEQALDAHRAARVDAPRADAHLQWAG